MWRELSFLEKWTLISGTIHAVSTFGLALVAVIGLYKVAPIIVYQVEQQEQQRLAQEGVVAPLGETALHSEIADVFVDDVLDWWTHQIESYRQILDLIDLQTRNRARLAFQIERSQPVPGAPEIKSDYLVLTATLDSRQQETARIPVNESAVCPNQYIQYKINHGAFADLGARPRQAVELAITSYVQTFMVPKVAPIYAESDMSWTQLRQAISDSQPHRLDALKHIRALKGIIDVSLESSG